MAAAKSRWEKGLRRLRLALTGEADAADVLEQSRARIWNARQALKRAAPPPRRRPFVQTVPSTDETDTDRRSYLVLILDPNGTVGIRKLMACDDDEAAARAHAQVEGCAFDVWDGLRFIEHFEPSVPAPEEIGETMTASRQQPRRGADEPGDSENRHEQGEAEQQDGAAEIRHVVHQSR